MDLKLLAGKKVFLTGHTGFKGSWMTILLHHLGAVIKGFSLPPKSSDDLYHQIDGDSLCYSSVMGDIRDYELLKGEIIRFQPDFIFHLAAQALVKDGYEYPLDTYATNVMGTAHLLNAVRGLDNKCVVVMITTDKVYENPENGRHFQEDDKLGGYDPYSASKACDEIIISSFRNSYFNTALYDKHLKSICSMRAGNVIGGGDYSPHRIIPDIVRAIKSDTPVRLRNPDAIRPWQYVIEPVYAYIITAIKMWEEPTAFNTAFNIGPHKEDMLRVEDVTKSFIQSFGKGTYEIEGNSNHQHEAGLLFLDNSKIKNLLGFIPKLNAQEAIQWTADWYADNDNSPLEKSLNQIKKYLTK